MQMFKHRVHFSGGFALSENPHDSPSRSGDLISPLILAAGFPHVLVLVIVFVVVIVVAN